MFTRHNWILIWNTITLFLYFNTTCANSSRNFAGIVENVTVYVLENASYFEDDNTFKSLKLNISWMPPNGDRKPSSYSVIITSILNETDGNRIECIEGSETHVQNNSQLNLIVPKNDKSEIHIFPSCTYKIQVYANPRAKSIIKLPEVIYTVPKCIRHKCSCVNAKTILPIPKVSAIQTKKQVVINWNVTILNNSYIRSYVISIGIPLLISKAGNLVYNITKITDVNSTINTFVWDFKINDQDIKIKDEYKILVMATDDQGCLGTPGDFIIITTGEIETSQKSIIWLLLAGIIICVIIIIINFILMRARNRYQFLWSSKFSSGRRPLCKSQWPNLILQKRNILYVEKLEETCCKTHENDESEIPYNRINFMYELGKGQFGEVYLGSLSNNEDTLVAIKMSQCSDTSDESRQQLLQEIKAMKAAGSHPHLVSLIGYCTVPDKPICILLEYMEGGDLLAYLHSRRVIETNEISLCNFDEPTAKYINIAEKDKKALCGMITKQQLMRFALDIAKGMAHLEVKEITHRDLAARNILLTSDLTLKVSDFGMSRNGIYVINNTVGTVRRLPMRWMSPEAVYHRLSSSKSDVWSFAIVLWEIGTLGSFPYPNIPDNELFRYLTEDNPRLDCPDAISHDIYKIMCSCWNMVPQDRPSFAQLVLDLQMLRESSYIVLDE